MGFLAADNPWLAIFTRKLGDLIDVILGDEAGSRVHIVRDPDSVADKIGKRDDRNLALQEGLLVDRVVDRPALDCFGDRL